MTAARAAAMVLALSAVTLAGCSAVSVEPRDTTDQPVVQLWNGPTTPTLVATIGTPGTAGDWPGRIDAPMAFADFDGDGRLEIVTVSDDRLVRVFDADGATLAALPSRYPPSWHIERVLNEPVVAMMRPGEGFSIVATNPAAYVEAWRFDPTPDEPWRFTKTVETRTDVCHRSPGMDGGAAVADVDGDGEMEILVQTEEIGFYALETDGSVLWRQCWAGGNSGPVVDDLDGDGDLEAVFASDAGLIAVVDGATGKPQWTFDVAAQNITPASIVVHPTVAELDGHAPKEVLFTARHAPRDDPENYTSYHMAIGAVRQNLTTWQPELVWSRQPTWAHPMSNTPLVVLDADGDGAMDIFGMDWNTIGHRPGDWSVLGPAHVFRLAADGSDVWVREVEAWWSNKAILVADVDGDGVIEVLANGPRGGLDGLWRMDATDGRTEGTLIADGWKTTRGPQLVALEPGEGLDLVFPVEPDDGTRRGAVLRYDLGIDGTALQGFQEAV